MAALGGDFYQGSVQSGQVIRLLSIRRGRMGLLHPHLRLSELFSAGMLRSIGFAIFTDNVYCAMFSSS